MGSSVALPLARRSRQPLAKWLLAAFAVLLVLSSGVQSARSSGPTHVATVTYSTNQTWTLANSPYILDGNVTVAAGATLTIAPGVVVKLNGQSRKLIVNGTLSAVGTAVARIVFTSIQDDSIAGDSGGDGQTVGAPGQWYQLNLNSSTSQFSYTDLRYGGWGSASYAYGAIDLTPSHSVSIDHANFSYNLESGVTLSNNAWAAISDSTFTHNAIGVAASNAAFSFARSTSASNTQDGLWFNLSSYTGAATSVTGSELTGNQRYGLYMGLDSSTPLASTPAGSSNDIYGNSGTKQLYTLTTRPNLDVNWRGNYWGSDVYYWYAPSSCTGSSPYATGRLAYRSSNTNPPAGPLTSSNYNVGTSACGYDTFKVGPGDFWTTPLNGSPRVPLSYTLGYCVSGCDAQNPTSSFADPVNTATGSFTHTATDASLAAAGVPFAFTRSYNSVDLTQGELGQGWTDNYAAALTIATNGDVTLRAGDGQQVAYTKQFDGSFLAPPGGLSSLAAVAGSYQLTQVDQTRYSFDGQGRLTGVVDRNGQGVTLSYGAGSRWASLTDSAGHTVTASRDTAGRLTGLSLPDGRSVGYAYTNGLLTSVTDVRGKVWTFSYDSHGFLATEVDPNSHTVVQNTYGSDGRVSQQKDALNHQTTFSWDPATQTETATDPRGNAWKDVYANNVLAQQLDPAGDTTQFGRDNAINNTSVASPSGATTAMTYDSRGNVLTATAPASLNNATKTFTYDTQNNVKTVTDARGNITTYTYDTAGNLTETDLNGVQIAAATYNSAGQTLTSTDANGHTTTNTYNSYGNVASTSDPLGNKTTYTYDAAGDVLTKTDPLGNVAGANPADYTTTSTYDAAGNLLTETDPLGHTTTNTYDPAGNLLTTTDPNGHTTTNTYDADNHLLTTTGADPDGAGPLAAPVTTYTYDAAGNKLTVTDPNNHTTTYAYTTSNQLLSKTTAAGNKTTYTYDVNGNLASTTDPRGNVTGANPADYTTTYTYDAAGRKLASTDPLGHSTTNGYDAVGNRTSVTDANNHTTTYTYDGNGNVLTATAPDGGLTTYTYDGNGNVLIRTDNNNHTTNYVYDNANQMIQTTGPDPDGAGPLNAPVTTNSYDANGNLTSTTDPNGNATPAVGDGTTTHNYDRANRLIGIMYSDATPSVTYTYDAAGNRTAMTDGAGSVTYTLDNLNRPTAVTRGSDTFSYGYDAASNITSRAFPGSLATSYVYDADNQMTSATTTGAATSYAYDAAGNLTQTTLPTGNGYVETRTYDKAGRLTDVKNANSTSVLSEFAGTLDPVGNPTEIDRSGATTSTTTYGYDANDRLIGVCYQATCPNSSDPYIRWTYDKVGNRLTETRPSGTTNYTYNGLDELTQAGSTTYGYDANGNELTAASNTYGYDLANRMTSSSDGTTSTTYSYDGDGNRLQDSNGPLPSQTTNYLWDTNAVSGIPQLALEENGSGSLLRSYAYGVNRISMTSGGSPYYYYHHDLLGSVANVTSSTGASEWTYAYDPFGATRTVTQNDANAPTNPMQFAGEYNDPNNLYNLRARQYDTASGRMLAVDPVAPGVGEASRSAYSYANDQPTVLIDPTGKTFMAIETGTQTAECVTSGNTDCLAYSEIGPAAGSSNSYSSGLDATCRTRDWVQVDPSGRCVSRVINQRSFTLQHQALITFLEKYDALNIYEAKIVFAESSGCTHASEGKCYGPSDTTFYGLGQLSISLRQKYLPGRITTTSPWLQVWAMRKYIRAIYGTAETAWNTRESRCGGPLGCWY